MLIAVIISAFALGAVWVYIIPMIQQYVPGALTTNKWASIAVTGVFILLAVWIVSVVVKQFHVKRIA